MKLSKDGKTVSLAKEELETLLRSMGQFEKIVKEFERQEAAGKLSPEWQRQWSNLKKSLDQEERQAAGAGKAGVRAVTTRCCILRSNLADPIDCREYTSRYVFALAACVGRAIALGVNATLVAGKCSSVAGCPQA
jgi:hypothetical protein